MKVDTFGVPSPRPPVPEVFSKTGVPFCGGDFPTENEESASTAVQPRTASGSIFTAVWDCEGCFTFSLTVSYRKC